MTPSRTNSKEISGRIYWVIASIILLAAAIMRVRAYEPTGYWLDELYALKITGSGSVLNILQAIPQSDDNPPLYYLLLAAWQEVIGSSELVTRSLSLLLSWMAVATVAFSRRTLGAPVALGAAALMAVLPGALFPVEARPYGLTILLATFVTLSWMNLNQPANGWGYRSLIIWAVASAFLSFTHLFGALFVGALILVTAMLWRFMQTPSSLLRFLGVSALSFVPLFLWILYARDSFIGRSRGSHWLQAPPPTMAIDFVGWVVGGTFLSAVLIGMAIAAGVALTYRWKALPREKFVAIALLLAVGVVLITAQLVSLWTPIWLDKYGVVVVPAMVIASIMLIYLITAPQLITFVGVVSLVLLAVLITNRNPRPIIPVEGWRETLETVTSPHHSWRTYSLFAISEWEAELWSAYPLSSVHGVYVTFDVGPLSKTNSTVPDSGVQDNPTFVLHSPYSTQLSKADSNHDSRNCKKENFAVAPNFGFVQCP